MAPHTLEGPGPQPRRTMRGHIAKALIAAAVLMPALLLVGVFIARSRGVAIGFDRARFQAAFFIDGALLILGLFLHRGEEL